MGFYAQWLNDTGLVQAWAFDATDDVERVTKGVVAPLDIASDLAIERTFDYALCLEQAGRYDPTGGTRNVLRKSFLSKKAARGDTHVGTGVEGGAAFPRTPTRKTGPPE